MEPHPKVMSGVYNSKGWDDHKATVSEEKHKSLLKKESYAEPWQLKLRQKRNGVVSGPTLAGHAGGLWAGVGNDYNKCIKHFTILSAFRS